MKRIIATLTFFALCACAIPHMANAASMEGTWSGGGYVKPQSGKKERVRCRVTYHRESNTVYRVSASCATAETKIYQTGRVLSVKNNRYVGDFYNDQWDVRGRVRVVVRGNRQTVTLTSSKGSGSLSLRKR